MVVWIQNEVVWIKRTVIGTVQTLLTKLLLHNIRFYVHSFTKYFQKVCMLNFKTSYATFNLFQDFCITLQQKVEEM